MYNQDDAAKAIINPDDGNKKENNEQELFPMYSRELVQQQTSKTIEKNGPNDGGQTIAYVQPSGASGQPGSYSGNPANYAGQPQNPSAIYQGYGAMQPHPHMATGLTMGGSLNPSFGQPSHFSMNPGMNGMVTTNMPPGGIYMVYPPDLYIIIDGGKFMNKYTS